MTADTTTGGPASKHPAGLRRPTKQDRILRALRHGSLNRFEAEPLGDHCLNSTVLTLQNEDGIRIARHDEKVPTRFGSSATVCRYRVMPTPENLRRADAMLAECRWPDGWGR